MQIEETVKIHITETPKPVEAEQPMPAKGQDNEIQMIKEDISNRNINDKIIFTGFVKNVQDYMRVSEIFFSHPKLRDLDVYS